MKEAITFHKYALPIFTLVCVMFYGFTSEAAEEPIELEKFKCKIVNSNSIIQRCENREVICYLFGGHRKGGMSCKFKEKK